MRCYLELTDGREFTAKQMEVLRKHLALVFVHEIDPTFGDKEKQGALDKIHQTLSPREDLKFRC